MSKKENMITVYHGTASLYEDDIRKNGLLSYRESGEVYFSPHKTRAEMYAQAWSFGLDEVDLMPDPVGLIVSFIIPEGTEVKQVQRSDFSISGPIPPSQIVGIERIDFSDVRGYEWAARLFDFLGVVGWDYDPYLNNNFDKIREQVRNTINQIPDHMLSYGILHTSSL